MLHDVLFAFRFLQVLPACSASALLCIIRFLAVLPCYASLPCFLGSGALVLIVVSIV